MKVMIDAAIFYGWITAAAGLIFGLYHQCALGRGLGWKANSGLSFAGVLALSLVLIRWSAWR